MSSLSPQLGTVRPSHQRKTVSDAVMTAVSGATVDLLNPSSEQITISDMAYGLSRTSRFGGHTKTTTPLTVAQHCILVADLTVGNGPEMYLHGLLHDAHEAYVTDIPTPVALALDALMPGSRAVLRGIKHSLDIAIYRHLNLALPTPEQEKVIKRFDDEALAIERGYRGEVLSPIEAAKKWQTLVLQHISQLTFA